MVFIPHNASHYCLVDASWKDAKEDGGIGWSLYSKEGIQVLRGSSSIHSTNSSLEAEAISMSMAVQQMRALRYENVAFISDCKSLIEEIKQAQSQQALRVVRSSEAHSFIQDILIMSGSLKFSFHYGPRSLLAYVDVLAKTARVRKQDYVLCNHFCLIIYKVDKKKKKIFEKPTNVTDT